MEPGRHHIFLGVTPTLWSCLCITYTTGSGQWRHTALILNQNCTQQLGLQINIQRSNEIHNTNRLTMSLQLPGLSRAKDNCCNCSLQNEILILNEKIQLILKSIRFWTAIKDYFHYWLIGKLFSTLKTDILLLFTCKLRSIYSPFH